jgi:hypothetical protein
MLTDPREALAEQNAAVNVLAGLAGLARAVRALAHGSGSGATEADDVVHVLLGLASLGGAVERLAKPNQALQQPSLAPSTGDLLR